MTLNNIKRKLAAGFNFGCIIVCSVLLAASCKTPQSLPEANGSAATIQRGTGTFVFNHYAPLQNKPINVWYYVPAGEIKDLPIMILLHGNSRAAESYRDRMAAHARTHRFILMVPEFSTDQFPGSRTYHQGHVKESDGSLRPEELWTFSIIEPLFDMVREDLESTRERYLMYGFSAGAQFVHRFNWHKPVNRAEAIVSASAGYYSMPDFEIDYPYGLKGSAVKPEWLKASYAQKLLVLVGDQDNNRGDSDLIKNDRADVQGLERVERAQNFFEQNKLNAEQMGVPFNWEFSIVPGIGHSQAGMAGPVAKILLGK